MEAELARARRLRAFVEGAEAASARGEAALAAEAFAQCAEFSVRKGGRASCTRRSRRCALSRCAAPLSRLCCARAAAHAARPHSLLPSLPPLRPQSAPRVALGAAAAELARGNPDRAQRLTLQLIKRDNTLPRAFVLRGLAFFQSGDFEQADRHLREALRLDIDCQEAVRAVKQARGASSSSLRRRGLMLLFLSQAGLAGRQPRAWS